MKIRPKTLSLIILTAALVAVSARTGSAFRLAGAQAESEIVPLSPTAGGENCASVATISTLPFNDSGNTTGAVDDIRLTGCSGFLSKPGPDHIYKFDVFAGNSLTFTVSTTSSDYDPAIYIRTACAQGSGSCVAFTDVGDLGQPDTLMVSNLAPGTYYFYVDSIYSEKEIGGFGPYTLSVTGTFGTPNNTKFFTVAPCRVLDTRDPAGPLGGPALAGGTARNFTIAGNCLIPPTAKSVSINATATQPNAQGHLVIFPAGAAIPNSSIINFRPGQTRANNAIVALGAGGALSVADGQPAGGTVHFILDVNGYFQ